MRKLRKIISMLVIAATIFTFFPDSVNALEKTPDFSEGEKVGDYTVDSVTDFSAYDSKVYVFVHDKTGAKVEFIKNDDPNRYFMLEFETPAENNKGTSHVFEHSVMNGSVKYPSRSLTSALRSRSYMTFLNAFTKEACTLYPVASLSEAQLLKFADYYTDLCFEPMILEDEDIFRSEAWRLSLADPKGDLSINGTIYSEMSGNYTADVAASEKAMGLLYPGCVSSYSAGGIPGEILKLKYDEVKEYHEKYYRPSNCIAYLCGDIKDPEAFLELLDGYFDEFDRKGTPEEKNDNNSRSGYTEMKYAFPEPVADDAANVSEMVYAIDLGHPDDEELEKLYAFAKCCDLEYSTPQLTLRTIFPGSQFGFSLLVDNGNAALTIKASAMNRDEAPYLRQAVLGVFVDMATNGLSDEELSYFRNRLETDVALAREGDKAVINLLVSISNYNSGGRGELFYIKMREHMADMSWFDNDVVKDISAAYFANPSWSCLAVVTPDGGLYEENEKALADSLNEIKSSMTDKEKNDLIAETKRVIQKTADDPSKYLDELNVVGVSDLTDDLRSFETSDSTDAKGIRRVGVYTDEDDVIVTRLYLDATGLPSDLLCYMSLYTDLVNGSFVATGKRDRGGIPFAVNECTGKGQEMSCIVTSAGDDYKPYVLTSFVCSPDKLEAAYDLAYERLFESKFDDPVKIKEGIVSIKNIVRSNIQNNPDNIAFYAAASDDAEGMAYYAHTHYLEYYDFLTELEKNIGGDFKNICTKLEEVEKFLCNSNGAVVGYALSKDNETGYKKCADAFMSKLGNTEHKPCEYEFAKHKYPLAIVMESRVVSNAVATGDAAKLGIEEDSACNSLALGILNDRYILPQTRDIYGAYRSTCTDRYPALAVCTGSDPVINETYETYSHMGEAWNVICDGMTQEDLDGYIITNHSNRSVSAGKISDATSVISDVVSGRGANYRHDQLAGIKSAGLFDLEKYGAFFEKLGNEANKVTVGSKAMIEKNKDMFAEIIDPFAK